jgi:23S rRNA (guanosine2251-2'-O)-methyltransferase
MRKLRNEELDRLTVEEIGKVDKNPFVILLDNIRSMHNVGSAFRTADAFLCEKIMLCGITAQPPHREIHKTALGATDSVDWEYFENAIEAIDLLKAEGYKIISIEQVEGSTSLENFQYASYEKLALIFGNEVKGVSQELVEKSDEVIEIPQFGTKHSINVSVSIGVVIWDLITKVKK